MMKTFEEIREIYIERYPYLANIRYGNGKRRFAQVAILLAVPRGITPMDLWNLSKVANGEPMVKSGNPMT